MTPEQYMVFVRETMTYPKDIQYPELGLLGECGELANKIKKIYRDAAFNWSEIKSEMGDVLWYIFAMISDHKIEKFYFTGSKIVKGDIVERVIVLHRKAMAFINNPTEVTALLCIGSLATCAGYYDWSLEDVARHNVQKLSDRRNRGVLQGSGDNR